jgi:hypothetical protein
MAFMPDTHEDFVRAWRCDSFMHQLERVGGCWTSTHISRYDIAREAASCADSCQCWRHEILIYTSDYGEYTGPAGDSPEEQIRVRREYIAQLKPSYDRYLGEANILKRKIDATEDEIRKLGGTIEELENFSVDFTNLLEEL